MLAYCTVSSRPYVCTVLSTSGPTPTVLSASLTHDDLLYVLLYGILASTSGNARVPRRFN